MLKFHSRIDFNVIVLSTFFIFIFLITFTHENCFALTPDNGSNPPPPPQAGKVKTEISSTSPSQQSIMTVSSSGQYKTMSLSGVSVNSGAQYTNSRYVGVSIYGSANYICFANDGDTYYSNWESFTTYKSWALKDSDGNRTVYVCVATFTGYDQNGKAVYYYEYSNDSITLDRTPPYANAGQDITVEKNVSVTLYGGGSYDLSGIAHYYWDDRTDTTVSYTVTHNQYGTYQHKLKVYDFAGNYSIDYVTIFVKDLSSPVVNISSPSNGSIVKGIIPIQFSATDNDVVARYAINIGGTTYDPVSSPYNFNTTSKSDGSCIITVSAYDAYGNRGEKSVNVVIDNNPPSVTINSPITTYVPGTSVNINFSATDPSGLASNPYSVEIDGSPAATSNSYIWETSSYSHASSHIITCKAKSILNNTGLASKTVYIDRVNPSVSNISPSSGLTDLKGNLNITFNASDGLSGLDRCVLKIIKQNFEIWTEQKYVTGYSASMSFLWNSDPYDGDIIIECIAYDKAGNAGHNESYVSILNPPPAPSNLKVDNAQNNKVILSWGTPYKPIDFKQYVLFRKKASDPSYTQIGTSMGESYNDYSAVNGTTYYYKVKAEDQSGNSSDYSNSISAYVVDTLPPAVPNIIDYWADDHYVKLIWNRNTIDNDLAGYNVYYSFSSTGPYTKANSSLLLQPATGNPYYEITGLTNDVSYFFFVSAVDTWTPPNVSAKSGYQEIVPGHGVEVVSINGNNSGNVEIDPFSTGTNREAVIQYYTRNICDWSVLSILNATSNAEVYRSGVINPHMYLKPDVQQVINTIPLLYWDCRSSIAGQIGEIVPAGNYKVHIEAGRGIMSSGSDIGLASVSVRDTSAIASSTGGRWWKWWDYNIIVKGINYETCKIDLSSYLDKVPANNSIKSTVTATVTDNNGKPLKNTLIKLSTNIGNIDTDLNTPGNQVQKQTNSDGKVSAYFSSGVLGLANIKAEIASTPSVFGTVGIDVINVQITPDPANTLLGLPIIFSANATDASGRPVYLSNTQWTMDSNYNILINNILYPRHLTGGGKNCVISYKYKGVVFDFVNVSINRPSSLGNAYNNYDSLIIDASDKYGIPPQLLKAQISHESDGNFNANAYRYEPYYDYLYISTSNNQPNILSYPYNMYAVEGIDSSYRTIQHGNSLPSNYLDVLEKYSQIHVNITDDDPSDNYGLTVWDLCDHNPNMRWKKPSVNFTAQVVVSSSYGLSQVMYPTAVWMNYSGSPHGLFVPSLIINMGADYLSRYYYNTGNWDSDWDKALLRYNGGGDTSYPSKVRQWINNCMPK